MWNSALRTSALLGVLLLLGAGTALAQTGQMFGEMVMGRQDVGGLFSATSTGMVAHGNPNYNLNYFGGDR